MAYSPRSSRSPMKRNRFRPVGMSNPNVHGGHSDELDGERLAFLNTALEAIPGITLRERFAPIVRLKKNMLMRKKHTQTRLRNETRPYDRVVTDALTALAKSLTEAAGDAIHDAAFPLNVNTFVELLRDKVEPVSYSAGSVLLYPNEPPESMFVYMLTNGAVSVTHYQQVRRAAAMERKQYITSGSESVFLCGGGLMLENLIAQQQQENAGAGDFNDAVSFSNVTTAIQRSLKRASRIIGQPTLQPGRSEMLKAPAVICGGDALGLAPHKCASCLATTCATSKGGDTILEEFVDVLRLRMIDVHEALMELATREMEARLRSQESGDNPFFADVTQAWFAVPYGMMPPRGTQRTLAEFISAARIKVLTTHYPQNELSMRQSWLLQDTPPPTVRSLISNLTARTFMPGEVIACQHCTTSATRQLCFLRRGEIHIEEAPPLTHGKGKHAPHLGGTVRCTCGGFQGRTLEAINAGVSFGELSVLFGESRNYTLRAATVCDVWCLSHNNFAQTMRRDDALRTSLVAKAAALRIKWLGEQRFTTALAEHLRNSTELFRPFADPVMRLIQERIEPVVYSPGSLIASTSTRCTEMIFIISGKVASICDGVANFGPGDVLGEGCLIPHRWPISLAARTMVEGWTLNRDRLNDALERADKLHSHSGIITNLAHILIKDIFGAPLPELKTDAVGRQQMPIVAAAPGGQSYPIYARQVAEVQLKATCFLYRDFVKWEDINYGTMESSKSGSAQERAESEAIARDYAVRRLRERLGVAPRARNASVANMLDAAVARKSQANPRRSTVTNVEAPPPPTSRTTAVAVGSGSAAAKAKNASATKKIPGGAAAYRKKRRNNTGSCAFLVDSDVTRTPFAPITVKRDTSPSRAGARVVAMESDNVAIGVLQRRPSTLQALMKRIRRNYRHPRGLHRFSKMLEERDRVMASEARQEAAIEKKLYGTDAITSARSELSDPNRGALIATAPVDHALMATSPLPPVHVFLSAEKPRAELTVNEAISIGYVMQLPDTQCIQACVSFVDPDVTVGLPHHRARRYAMAVTPNNRYTKHNFLFAASTFDDAIKRAAEEEAKAELERAARAKSHKLYTILQNNLQTQGELSERRTQSDGPFGGFTAQTVATEGAVTTADLGAAEQPLSRLGSASGTPMQQSFSHLGGGLGSGEAAARSRTGSFSVVPGSLTPFRGGEAVRKKKEEAFLRLLNRTPLKAMDLLFAKYHVPWRTTTDEPHTTTGPEDVVERLRRVRAELPLRKQPGLAAITPRSARCGWQHATAAAPSLELSGTLNQTARVKGVDGYLQSKDAVFYLDRFGALNAASLADRPGIIILPIGASAQLGGMGASPSAHLELSMSSMGGSQWKRAGTLEGSLMMIPSALDAGSPSRITTDGMNAPVDGFDALTPKDFVMPDDEEANAMMRRIQRDVDGLNAVARHQTRERERHNRQEKRAKLVEELLANPTTEEQLLLDDWRQSYHLQTKEGTQRIAIPKALIPEAGVDFLQREVRRLNHLDGPVADSQRRATTSGVEEWQEDLVGGGGYKKSGSAARRVVAAVGTAQLGYRATPLTNPTAHLSAAEYEAYVAEREALFQAYTRRDASMPDAGIPGFVVSRPTTARPATNIKAAAQEEEKEEYIDSDYEPSPVKPTPSS